MLIAMKYRFKLCTKQIDKKDKRCTFQFTRCAEIINEVTVFIYSQMAQDWRFKEASDFPGVRKRHRGNFC